MIRFAYASASKMLWISLICVLLHFADGQRIVNGTDAGQGEFPFMVSLRNYTNHMCGATIVNENYVLTAAHCVCYDYASPQGLSIQYGLLSISKTDNNSIPVTEIICHENYNASALWIYDVAVLKLKSPVPEEFLSTTNLAPSNFSTENEQEGTVIGWGRVYTDSELPEKLQKVNVVVYSNEICNKTQDGMLNLQHHMCAGVPENGKGSCQGDSGGPLLVGVVQVGVVSWGTGGDCGISNTTNAKVLARVSSYRDWIIEKSSSSSNIVASIFVLFFFVVVQFVINF